MRITSAQIKVATQRFEKNGNSVRYLPPQESPLPAEFRVNMVTAPKSQAIQESFSGLIAYGMRNAVKTH